jgi:hypothetical protein
MISPDFPVARVTSAFEVTVQIYGGTYPGYQACNTRYHNLRHTTDDFLAMSRLIHGATLDGEKFEKSLISVALVAALFHDVGYVQRDDDHEGTGAKYTVGHVERSMDFLEQYCRERGFSEGEIAGGRNMILCTDLGADVAGIPFASRDVEMLGKMLGTADILAQMADRTYLEKLLFLYHEFREGKVGDYADEEDLLRKSVAFFDFALNRLRQTLGGVDRFMTSHFASRWGLQANLYNEAIERHRKYLTEALEKPDFSPEVYLKRDGIVKQVRTLYEDEEED